MKNIVSVSPNKFLQINAIVIVSFILLSAAGSIWNLVSIDDYFLAEMRESFVRLFSPNEEANMITWYSASILLLSSFLLGIIAFFKKSNYDSYTFHWGFLSLVFLYLSVDEAAVIHEMADSPLRSLFNLGAFSYCGWILPAGIAVIIFGLAYLKFLFHLPFKTRCMFLVAGGIFVGGTIGLDSVGGYLHYLYIQGRIANDEMVLIFETIEEFMEMSGIVIFIYALLDYMSLHLTDLRIRILNSK